MKSSNKPHFYYERYERIIQYIKHVRKLNEKASLQLGKEKWEFKA